MIEIAIKIDNRNYKRALEKKGHYNLGQRSYKKSSGNWPQLMELDATMERKPILPQEKEKHMRERTCFKCGKPGHIARNCYRRGTKEPQRGKTRTAKRHRTRGL